MINRHGSQLNNQIVNGTPRILHTMLRVGDIARSVDFYTKILGMEVLRTLDQPEEKYSLTFLGYGKETESSVLELTYNYGVAEYEVGDGYGHIAISVHNCHRACERVKALGQEVHLEPRRLKGTNEIIAFIRDPDGYQIELIQHVIDKPNSQ